jgi:hypothetical protein
VEEDHTLLGKLGIEESGGQEEMFRRLSSKNM